MVPQSNLPRFVIGIDLGTTNTVAAFADTSDNSEINVFQLEQFVAAGEIDARPSLPSVRYHPLDQEIADSERRLPWANDEDALLGQWALSKGASVAGRLVSSAKSWLSHEAVDRRAPILPWGSTDVTQVSPVDASASYLSYLRKAWDHEHPNAPMASQEVVLTVPASFDESARALTLEAAKAAGLARVRLVEEPQAAFYNWLSQADEGEGTLEAALGDTKLALVVDVGGGTTDLTLIKVEQRESGPRLTRIAVGEHLMLGGDNMDLALAKTVEARLQSSSLSAARFHQLLAQCRTAKEAMLSESPVDSVGITLVGAGSKLIGSTMKAELTRDEVHQLILDGFFPSVEKTEVPQKRRGGIVEFGLPYVADAGITRHVAEFLVRHADLIKESGVTSGVPDAILFNGGVFRGDLIRTRLTQVLSDWKDAPVTTLAGSHPDSAVAQGAVAYGLSRRGIGLRIGGGSARSYFVVIDDKEQAGHKTGICVLPKGSEEGEEVPLKERRFQLRLGRPVQFQLVSTTSDVKHIAPGDMVEIDESERYKNLPPIAAVLGESSDDGAQELPVQLRAALTEVGTLEMSFVARDDDSRRFKMEFQLRGKSSQEGVTHRITQLHPRFSEATDRVREVYGKSKAKETLRPKDVKRLRADLEKILGTRDEWNPPLLRELFGALFAGAKRRRRSKDHERVWFHLIGYALRPGYGYALDDWRIKQLWELWGAGVQFSPETQNWSEFWIMWRRVAGGLTEEMQKKLLREIEYYLQPPTKKPRPRPKGPKKLGQDDMIRLAGSLERISADQKAQVGGWLVKRLIDHDENAQAWWSVGRLGARVPFYGSAHEVVPRHVATEWLEQSSRFDWVETREAAFAATLLSRMSGDRERDLPEQTRKNVAEKLREANAPESWIQMVSEVVVLDAADEQKMFGDSLPPGLRLLD